MMASTISMAPSSMLSGVSSQFDEGYQFGKQLGKQMMAEQRKGLSGGSATKYVGSLFGLLIFSYFAAELGPDIIQNFTNNSISGTEGELWSLGGILVVFGVLVGVGAAVGLNMS